jgi:hypothetical protein
MFFEQLPIPTQLYDDIIQERAINGEVYLPKTSKEYIDELDSHGSSGAGSLLSAVKRLEKIRHELKEGNPLFNNLVEHVVDSVEENRNTSIFARGSKMEEILQEALEDRSEIDDGWFGDLVSVVSPDSVRDIEPHEELVFAGPQFPGYACFYLHPRVKQTHILTCTDWSAEMVRRHIDDAVKSLNQTFPLNEKVVEGFGYSGSDNPQENGQSEDEVDIPEDLQKEDLDRLKELVKLAPTKNGELAESWGYESGSEVYQYLSSSLGEYYTRNEDNLIVPKEEGKEIVESWESE